MSAMNTSRMAEIARSRRVLSSTRWLMGVVLPDSWLHPPLWLRTRWQAQACSLADCRTGGTSGQWASGPPPEWLAQPGRAPEAGGSRSPLIGTIHRLGGRFQLLDGLLQLGAQVVHLQPFGLLQIVVQILQLELCSSSALTELAVLRISLIQWLAVRIATGNRSGPSTTRATTPMTTSSQKPMSNMA